MPLKRASEYFSGGPTVPDFYSPLWRWIGADFLESVNKVEYDSELYVKEREERPDVSGIEESDVLDYINSDSYKILVVVGPAGVGKTTMMNHIIDQYEEEHCFKSIVINIKIHHTSSLLEEDAISDIENALGERLAFLMLENDPDQIKWYMYLLENWNDSKGRTSILRQLLVQANDLHAIIPDLISILNELPIRRLNFLRMDYLLNVDGMKPVLFIDNADNIPSRIAVALFDLFQMVSGTNSLERIRRKHIPVIFALRPKTLASISINRARNNGNFLIGSLKPPKLSIVIEKRAKKFFTTFLGNVLPGNLAVKYDELGRIEDIWSLVENRNSSEENQEILKKMILDITHSLTLAFAEKEKEEHYFLHELSNYNIRLCLAAVSSFIAPGLLDWKKFTKNQMANRRFSFSNDKLLKSLLLGTHHIYSTTSSWPINLFNDLIADSTSCVIYLRILKFFYWRKTTIVDEGLTVSQVQFMMRKLFSYPGNRTKRVVELAFKDGLIELERFNEKNHSEVYFITTAGVRYLKSMTTNFEYLQHIAIDCFVDSEHLVKCEIRDEVASIRFHRLVLFNDWILKQEINDMSHVLRNDSLQDYISIYGEDTISYSLAQTLVEHSTKTKLRSRLRFVDLERVKMLIVQCRYNFMKKAAQSLEPDSDAEQLRNRLSLHISGLLQEE